jgi:RHS repeat-associated protein
MVATNYTYDPAGHLATIVSGSHTVTYTFDAAGRHATQTIDSNPTTTYAYLGSSDQVTTMTGGGSATTYSTIDALGNRLATGTPGGAYGYLVPDLHGNVVCALGPGLTPGYLTAYRYDAYGETVGTWTATSGSIAIPWRYQGRILESASGSTDLYDFGARNYDPGLGVWACPGSTDRFAKPLRVA